MDKFFSIFGKIVGILLVAAGLIGIGVYVGQKYMTHNSTMGKIATIPTASITSTITPTISISPTTTSQKNPTGRTTIVAGGVTTFSSYMLSALTDWTPTKTHNTSMDELVLTKGDYQITILQGAVGAGACTFPGDTAADMSVALSSPVAQVSLLDGTILKRGTANSSTNPGKTTDTFCQKGSDGHFSTLTSFGVINYITPSNPDSQTLSEMDAMIGSLQKQ